MYFQEFLTCQVFEYLPKPWNQWVIVGDLVVARHRHATTSIDPRHLRCASGVFLGPQGPRVLPSMEPRVRQQEFTLLRPLFFLVGHPRYSPVQALVVQYSPVQPSILFY